ncbi:MAG: multidrug effflux MFS transporter [Simkaniaceae bacterium]|nr:multidrug effflux MFS transporter [Candidatus Sacchlamyda saccharinae]
MAEENNKAKRIISLIVFMTLILGFGIDLYAPSFPAIAKALKTSQQLVQLSIATYFFGYVLGMLFLGPLSDALGRRRPLIFGIGFYCLMSLACVFSPNIYFLLVLRMLQGMGVSAVGMLCRSILGDVFTGKQLAKAMSYYAMSYRLGPIIAPMVGGYLVFYFGWTSNFYFLTAFGLILLVCVTWLLPETHFDLTKFHPKLVFDRYASLLKKRVFLGGALCIGMLYSLMIIFNVVGPFFIQEILGHSPISYGNIAFLLGVIAFSGMLTNRFLMQYKPPEKMIAFGMSAIVVVVFLQVVLAYLFPVNLYSFLLPVMALLFLTGLINSNIMSRVIDSGGRGKGVASALVGILIISCTGILTALSSFLESTTARPFAFAFLAIVLVCFCSYKFLFKSSSVD